jgi:tetratricopeptide (TPR) repeat protein
MSNDKTKVPAAKPKAAPTGPAAKAASTPAATPGKIAPVPLPPPAPLFRRIDWITFIVTFAAVWIGYYLTLAPEHTLEDSGELATGSFYAGIPHPPGYPVWAIYTWIWTVLLPVKNIAWRVALGEATGGALAAGLLGLLVSRGSSLLMEGIEDLKNMTGHWESAICTVSGFVAGMLIGFNGFMWSQSVIVEVYAFSVASFMVVLLCLLRWIYAPQQRRYLFYALFFHGLCFTNHQTLIVAAMGIEVAIAAANFRMGRYLFLGNSIIYLCGLILKSAHMLTTLDANPAVFVIFNVVGVCSIAAYFWFTILSRETFPEFCLDASLAAALLLLSTGLANGGFVWVLAVGAIGAVVKFGWDTRKLGLEWLIVIGLGICWIIGAGFYFYMPLAGMSDPPMEWGYPRTVEGFIHAFTRGQYEKTSPSDIVGDPLRFITQLGMLGSGIIEEFNWVYGFLALVPFVFFLKMHRRERAWMIGIVAIYLCMGVLLLILLNPPPDRQAQGLVRVFFTASHTLISLLIGYGLTLVAAYMATHYMRFRFWGLIGGGVAVALSLYSFTDLTSKVYFGENASPSFPEILSFVGHVFSTKDQYGLPVYAGLILIGMAVLFLVALAIYRNRAPLLVTLGIFALMPLHSILTHWSDNEQRNHWFGYWFGHDMFTPPFKGADGKPLYPEMTKDTVLFGGTDPGRFCPTYMIFCDSFLPKNCQPEADPDFDRRDVYIITQNALADGTYLEYIRSQYNRSAQKDPPFFSELFRMIARDPEYQTNALARMATPLDRVFLGLGDSIEKRRRTYTSWFTAKDFTDLPGFATRLRNQQDALSKYIYENLSPETQKLISSNDKALADSLAADLNRLIDRELQVKKLLTDAQNEKSALDDEGSSSPSRVQRRQELEKEIANLSKIGPFYDPARFKDVTISEYLQDFIKENPQSHTRVRLNRLLLEAAYPKEIAKTLGGIYPDREIYTPSPEDSQRCFSEYMADAQRRLQLNQLKPGEDVKFDKDSGRVQVSGQVAVMAINGLLTKVIFDHNPKNEFFVEESFPLDWMYPYLTPFGIIMKINRNTLPELTEDIVKRDHEFWTQFAEKRLIGKSIVEYDTPVKKIADWIEKTYLRHDFTGFTGDRAFIRDDQGQKAFSKLRSSIGGVYAWRITDPSNHNPAVQQRMIKEADFAFRQAFAFCPYSPEAVFRYVNLLLSLQRFDDALIIASTCLKLDPYNGQVIDLVKRLQDFKQQQSQRAEMNPQLVQNLPAQEKAVKDNPDDFQAAFNLASSYLQLQQVDQAMKILDGVLNNPKANPMAYRALVQAYASFNRQDGLQNVIAKLEPLVKQNSTNYDAAAGLGEAYHHLKQSTQAVAALAPILNDPKVDGNLLLIAAQDFAAMHDYAKLETTLDHLVKALPTSPEAWYDLAAFKATVGKTPESLKALSQAFQLSAQRKKQDAKARDLIAEAKNDPRFAAVRQSPEFNKLAEAK